MGQTNCPIFNVNTYMTLLLGSPRTAATVFGTNTTPLMRSIPRIKFLYYVEFNPSPEASDMMLKADLNIVQGNRGIAFKVKTIDKPKITLTTKDLNQYNKKRLVYTGVDYGDVQLKLHDTVDDSVLSMWVDYFTYFFGDSRPHTAESYLQSPVGPQFVDSTGWGLRPLVEQTQFFESISVYAFFAQTYTKFSYINPKISLIDWQNHDYSSSEPEEVSITFKYEAIKYEAFAQPITQTEADRFNLGEGFYTAVGKNKVQPPRILSNQISAQSSDQQAGNSATNNPNNNMFTQSLIGAAFGTPTYSYGTSVIQATAGRLPYFTPPIVAQANLGILPGVNIGATVGLSPVFGTRASIGGSINIGGISVGGGLFF